MATRVMMSDVAVEQKLKSRIGTRVKDTESGEYGVLRERDVFKGRTDERRHVQGWAVVDLIVFEDTAKVRLAQYQQLESGRLVLSNTGFTAEEWKALEPALLRAMGPAPKA